MISKETQNPDVSNLNSTNLSAIPKQQTDHDHHIFRSKLPDIPIPDHLPLHSYCFQNLAQFAHCPCLIVGSTEKTYSFAETHLISCKVAAGFAHLGLKQGDVVMLLQNCAEFVFSFLGASILGAVTTTANPFYTSAKIFKQLNASKAKIVVTQTQCVDKLRESPDGQGPKIGEDFSVVTVDDPLDNCKHFSALSEGNEAEIPEVSVDSDDPVALSLFRRGAQITPRVGLSAVKFF